MQTIPISDIKIGDRFREDLGGVDALAQSLEEIGLLHPVVVSPDMRLIAGMRRLEAAKRLGWEAIPATVAELEKEGANDGNHAE